MELLSKGGFGLRAKVEAIHIQYAFQSVREA
jgi:hypothetical protein